MGPSSTRMLDRVDFPAFVDSPGAGSLAVSHRSRDFPDRSSIFEASRRGDTMSAQELEAIARKLIAPARGILAADESTGTIERRFKSINVPNTEASRQAYRDMLFTTPGFGEYISGVILFDETIRQKSLKGVPFTEVLTRSNSIPGIKVDAGAKPLPFAPDEMTTEGL